MVSTYFVPASGLRSRMIARKVPVPRSTSCSRIKSCELWSKLLKGGYIVHYIGEYLRGYKGDTWSLEYSSCVRWLPVFI